MAKAPDRIARLMAELKQRRIEYLRFELPDLHGIGRVKVVPIDKVEAYARKGLNFYGGALALDTASSVVPGATLNEERSYADQFLIPDPDTLQTIPWLPATARVICTGYWAPDEPQRAAPRWVLGSLVDEANRLGYDVMMGHEFEFYLLDGATKKQLFGGPHIFNVVRNQYVPFLDTFLDQLRATGIDIITHNAEYAGSQFETVYGPGLNVAAADKAYTFKNAVKELAHRAGYIATFMAKPFAAQAGSGCHVHVSLVERKSGRNAFFDPKAAGGVSALARSFTQGILDHARAMMPLIGPTPNCYHRIKPHTFAPSNIGWGIEDRSAMVRIKAHGDERTHIEMRAASAVSNPYLSAAATLAAGLLGIKGKRPLQPPVAGPTEDDPDLPKLPQNLEAALEALEADREMATLLGPDFIKVFTVVKRYELARFRSHITDWEVNEYLELY